jgi:hypothetical protein
MDVDEITVEFDDLDRMVGGLPTSASLRAWWANSGQAQSKAWIEAGWIVAGVSLASREVTFRRGRPVARRGVGRMEILDGAVALETTLKRAGFASVVAAVAGHAVFLDPATVAQTRGQALFPVVRSPERRGRFGRAADGRQVLFDDNTTPTLSFLWSAQRRNGHDVQLNHVWSRPADPDSYTALWKLCCTPAFLAKTTDTNREVRAALRFRSYELFGHEPAGEPIPDRPPAYDSLGWLPSPAPVVDLEALIRERMQRAPKSRPAQAAAKLGWLYSDGPDPCLRPIG